MKAIPKNLLIHKVFVKTPISEDSFGNIVYSESREINFVRVDYLDKLRLDNMNVENASSATLFYDCVNSSPVNFNFTKGQVVTFDESNFIVSSVLKLYDDSSLHHLEIELI